MHWPGREIGVGIEQYPRIWGLSASRNSRTASQKRRRQESPEAISSICPCRDTGGPRLIASAQGVIFLPKKCLKVQHNRIHM